MITPTTTLSDLGHLLEREHLHLRAARNPFKETWTVGLRTESHDFTGSGGDLVSAINDALHKAAE